MRFFFVIVEWFCYVSGSVGYRESQKDFRRLCSFCDLVAVFLLNFIELVVQFGSLYLLYLMMDVVGVQFFPFFGFWFSALCLVVACCYNFDVWY